MRRSGAVLCLLIGVLILAHQVQGTSTMASADPLPTARANMHKLWERVNMDDDEFACYSSQKEGIWTVLNIAESDVDSVHNSSVTVKGVRAVFRKYTFLFRDDLDVPLQLLRARVICKHCYRAGATAGIMYISASACKAHAASGAHQSNAAAATAAGMRQATLGEVGVAIEAPAPFNRSERARTLAVASLAAGGNGAAGVPPNAISALMDPAQLVLQQNMGGGFPAPLTIIRVDLPAACALVCDWIRDVFFVRWVTTFALAIDGGSCNLAWGRKCLALMALSPNAPFDVCLGLNFAFAHENGASQAAFINQVCLWC